MDSDDDLRHHCLHTIETACAYVIIAVCHRHSVHLAGNMALPCCGRRWGDQTAAAGRSGNEADVGGRWSRRKEVIC